HQAQGHPARVRAVRNRHSCLGAPPATSGDHPGILPGSRSGLYRNVSESPLATFPIGTANEAEKPRLMKETRDRTIDSVVSAPALWRPSSTPLRHEANV